MEKTTPEVLSDTFIISSLQSQSTRDRRHVFRQLCKDEAWKGLARSAILSVEGDESQVEEIFLESMSDFAHNIMQGKFKRESKLTTYFYAICKNKYLKRNKSKEIPVDKVPEKENPDDGIEKGIIEEENAKALKMIMHKLMGNMGDLCKKILKFNLRGYTMETIAYEMDYSSEQSAKQAAMRCREKLRELIEADPKLLKKIQSLR